jgi:3-dehydroquinate synthetase
MVAECRSASSAGALAAEAVDRVIEVCLALGLPGSAPPVSLAALVDASRMDKKRAHGIVYAPVPTRLGHAEMRPLEASEVERMLSFLAPNAAPLED